MRWCCGRPFNYSVAAAHLRRIDRAVSPTRFCCYGQNSGRCPARLPVQPGNPRLSSLEATRNSRHMPHPVLTGSALIARVLYNAIDTVLTKPVTVVQYLSGAEAPSVPDHVWGKRPEINTAFPFSPSRISLSVGGFEGDKKYYGSSTTNTLSIQLLVSEISSGKSCNGRNEEKKKGIRPTKLCSRKGSPVTIPFRRDQSGVKGAARETNRYI